MILLMPHPVGLDYNLDKNSNFPSKIDKVLMSTTGPTKLLEKKIGIAQKQGLLIMNTLH
jgi:hypothetical protein